MDPLQVLPPAAAKPIGNGGGDGDDDGGGDSCVAPPMMRMYRGVWIKETHLPFIETALEGFRSRPSDIFLVTFPKCGTTWLKALAYSISARRLHHPLSPDHPLLTMNPHELVPLLEFPFGRKTMEDLESLPSPRLIQTHLPLPLLMTVALDGGNPIVYLCREPKDTFVSWAKFISQANTPLMDARTTDELLDKYCRGDRYPGTLWEHAREYWEESKKVPQRVLFLRYEGMMRDPSEAARCLAEFIGFPFSGEEVAEGMVEDVVRLCSFDKLSALETNKKGSIGDEAVCVVNKATFFRNGKVGDWRNHMTPEMANRVDCIAREKLQGTGLEFE